MEDADGYVDVQHLTLQKVATRLALVPYTYLVRWRISYINIKTRTNVDKKTQVIGLFKPKYIEVIYKVPKLETNFDHGFLKEFIANEVKPIKVRFWGLLKNGSGMRIVFT